MVMVAPAPLMAWWQMAGRLVVAMLILVGQAALGRWVDPQLLGAVVEEEAVALVDIEVQYSMKLQAAGVVLKPHLF